VGVKVFSFPPRSEGVKRPERQNDPGLPSGSAVLSFETDPARPLPGAFFWAPSRGVLRRSRPHRSAD